MYIIKAAKSMTLRLFLLLMRCWAASLFIDGIHAEDGADGEVSE